MRAFNRASTGIIGLDKVLDHLRWGDNVVWQVDGYIPELSFGTHFFQDLVETRIFYAALFPDQDKALFRHQHLDNSSNYFAELLPDYAQWQSVIKVIEPARNNQELWLDADMQTQQTVCFFRSPSPVEPE